DRVQRAPEGVAAPSPGSARCGRRRADGGASAEELELPGGAPGSAGGCSRAGPSAVGGGGLEVREGDAEEADGLSDPGAGPELEGHFTQQRAVRGDVAEGLVAAEQRVVGFA